MYDNGICAAHQTENPICRYKDLNQMTKSNIQNALLKAAITFVALYLPIHLLFVEYGSRNELPVLTISILCGVLTSSMFKLPKIKAENYWTDVSVFVLVYGVILGVSAALFYAYIEQGTFMWQVFYYFPQMFAVAFMIPGVVVHCALIRSKYPKCKNTSHGLVVR